MCKEVNTTMFPGMNQKKMQQVMRQMGIKQQEVPATQVVISLEDKDIVITNPSVVKVNMMGQETFQISGVIHEKAHSTVPEISEEDIQTVASQANCSIEEAKAAIETANGDLAQAIMDLASNE